MHSIDGPAHTRGYKCGMRSLESAGVWRRGDGYPLVLLYFVGDLGGLGVPARLAARRAAFLLSFSRAAPAPPAAPALRAAFPPTGRAATASTTSRSSSSTSSSSSSAASAASLATTPRFAFFVFLPLSGSFSGCRRRRLAASLTCLRPLRGTEFASGQCAWNTGQESESVSSTTG